MSLVQSVSHALFRLVVALAKYLTDHTMLGLPIRADYKHVETMCI